MRGESTRRTFHDEEAEDEEHHHKSTHIHRTRCARLFAPVLSDLMIDTLIVGVGFLHRRLTLAEWHRRAAFSVRNQQRPGLIDTIAPLRDIIALQTAAGLVLTVLFHQLALATHRLLAVCCTARCDTDSTD